MSVPSSFEIYIIKVVIMYPIDLFIIRAYICMYASIVGIQPHCLLFFALMFGRIYGW